jgi:hypothetical protein
MSFFLVCPSSSLCSADDVRGMAADCLQPILTRLANIVNCGPIIIMTTPTATSTMTISNTPVALTINKANESKLLTAPLISSVSSSSPSTPLIEQFSLHDVTSILWSILPVCEFFEPAQSEQQLKYVDVTQFRHWMILAHQHQV